MGIACAPELPPGRTHALELDGAGDTPGLSPLVDAVTADGVALGTLTLAAAGRAARAELALPETGGPVEVRLSASDWTLAPVPERARVHWPPLSARLVFAETRP
jgi:hypothetical protein